MKYSISVPEPCHEAWDKMTPEGNGRHCLTCCKTVVDFTAWQEQDIINYLGENSSDQVCGRFSNEHLTPLENEDFIYSVVRSALPLYKKIAAILLMALGLIQLSGTTAVAQQHQEKGRITNDYSKHVVPHQGLHKRHPAVLGVPIPPPKLSEQTEHKKTTDKAQKNSLGKNKKSLIAAPAPPGVTAGAPLMVPGRDDDTLHK